MSTKSQWHVFHLQGDQLEEELNRLSNEEFKIFSVQYVDSSWVVIAEKVPKDDSGKISMGFSSKR